MAELATEREHLAKADRDIAAGERRIADHMLLIERLRDAGHETAGAEDLLVTLRQSLAVWRDHRVEILRRIEHLERTARP